MFEKKLGEIRPNQFITTYGPGAIMDAVHDSLTVLDIEYWNANNIGQEIRDSRLASFMNVRHFYMPSTKGKENIPVASFPYTHVCTNDRCKRLFDIREELKNTNYLENYKQHQGSASCPDCHYSAYPARFISICEDGHMDDFPWRWWCHNGKTDCKEKLRLKSFGTTSSLAELEVECDCGAKRRMSGSMQKENFDGWENFKSRNGEYVLIHTLSHMLIKEMAIQSGYSSSALHERIYSSDKMCGLLIYTGAADKEGSLGGLVELGSMEKLIPLLKGALENGLTCTTDPECFMKNPTTDRINGAACHSCTMISETACENGNRLLDRALVVPLPEHEEMGYFKELVNVLCGIQV